MPSDLRIVPITQKKAFEFVALWHRHHQPPRGCKYAIGVAVGNILVGVAITGRPVARLFDDGMTVEVTRVATDGAANACSMLYGASWRAAKALGFARAITYTQDGESGASLRAAGWIAHDARLRSRPGWNMPGRARSNDLYVSTERIRWEIMSERNAAPPPSEMVRPAAAPVAVPALFDLPAGGGRD